MPTTPVSSNPLRDTEADVLCGKSRYQLRPCKLLIENMQALVLLSYLEIIIFLALWHCFGNRFLTGMHGDFFHVNNSSVNNCLAFCVYVSLLLLWSILLLLELC